MHNYAALGKIYFYNSKYTLLHKYVALSNNSFKRFKAHRDKKRLCCKLKLHSSVQKIKTVFKKRATLKLHDQTSKYVGIWKKQDNHLNCLMNNKMNRKDEFCSVPY